VTHELRTPLTTFRMYTEMLDEGMASDGEKQKEYFRTLHSEAERLNHLVENVLDYAQLEKSRGGVERSETVRLTDLRERLGRLLADRARQNAMELKTEMEDSAGSASVRADLSAVERILFNLVDNAGKYGRDAQTSAVIFQIGMKNGKAVFSIRDHGPGIPPSRRKRLFDPFSKSASDAANSAPGIGLGLSISRGLARQMKGDLYLDEEIRNGARFVLTLPLA
jgi:signal transduction histidine kinase